MDERDAPRQGGLSPLILALRKITAGEVRPLEPLSRHTSFRIGGPAQALCRVGNLTEWRRVWEFCQRQGIRWRVLGGGTNLLVADEGVLGVVVQLAGEFRQTHWDRGGVYAGAGAGLARLVKEATARGGAGLEFAAGIPGSLGGAVVMNAGTRLGAMDAVLVEITLFGEDGEVRTVPAAELGLGYRQSRLQQTREVVLGATLRTRPGDRDLIQSAIAAQLEERRLRQPLDLPSAGSVFKNPPGDHAARLIEAAGLKGMRAGDAAFSAKHANFIVNLGRATAAHVKALMETAQSRVRERFGVELQPEIKCWQ